VGGGRKAKQALKIPGSFGVVVGPFADAANRSDGRRPSIAVYRLVAPAPNARLDANLTLATI
jgi:hypothetical protein